MKKRTWKIAGLVCCGGVLMQLSGCGVLIAQILIQQTLVDILAQIFNRLVGDTDAGNTTDETAKMLLG